MSLDIAPLPVEGTEDGALPSRGDFVSIRMPRCRVWRFCTSLRQGGERTLRCLRRFLQRRGELSAVPGDTPTSFLTDSRAMANDSLDCHHHRYDDHYNRYDDHYNHQQGSNYGT